GGPRRWCLDRHCRSRDPQRRPSHPSSPRRFRSRKPVEYQSRPPTARCPPALEQPKRDAECESTSERKCYAWRDLQESNIRAVGPTPKVATHVVLSATRSRPTTRCAVS